HASRSIGESSQVLQGGAYPEELFHGRIAIIQLSVCQLSPEIELHACCAIRGCRATGGPGGGSPSEGQAAGEPTRARLVQQFSKKAPQSQDEQMRGVPHRSRADSKPRLPP